LPRQVRSEAVLVNCILKSLTDDSVKTPGASGRHDESFASSAQLLLHGR